MSVVRCTEDGNRTEVQLCSFLANSLSGSELVKRQGVKFPRKIVISCNQVSLVGTIMAYDPKLKHTFPKDILMPVSVAKARKWISHLLNCRDNPVPCVARTELSHLLQ
ncbi:MAG: hypothetical protein HYW70_01540 [Candidatus Nealsonbacteria bacterium]|nr:hypothetical protein [Candidatus Nealsonbacteria bacterium]